MNETHFDRDDFALGQPTRHMQTKAGAEFPTLHILVQFRLKKLALKSNSRAVIYERTAHCRIVNLEVVNKITEGVIERFGRQSDVSNQPGTSWVDLGAKVKTKTVIARQFGRRLEEHDLFIKRYPSLRIHE